MDKKELKRSARTTERFKDIMNLRKSKEYDKIFEVYGQTIFKLAVPRKYQKAEVKELFEKGRWEDIYRKYGENTYNKYIYKMQEQEIYNETGSKPKSILNRIKNVFVHRIAPVMLSTALLTPPGVENIYICPFLNTPIPGFVGSKISVMFSSGTSTAVTM